MKLSKTTISTILLASLIALQLLAINVHSSIISAPNIYVENPATGNSQFIFYTDTTPVGFRFNATLWVSGYGNPPVYAWQVRLNYNPNQLNVTRAWVATNDSAYIFTGRESYPQKAIENTTILLGDTLLSQVDGQTPPPEPAKLATIEFEITSAPLTENLFSSLNIDNDDTYMIDTNIDIISVTKTSGQYEYIDLNLPAKVPSTITLDVNPPSVFTGEDVTISGSITPTRPYAPVTINAKFNGYNWFTLAQVETDSASNYLYVWKPMNAALYQIQSSWPGDENTYGDDSPVATLLVNSSGPPPPSTTISVVNPQTGNNQFTFFADTTQVGDRFNATLWVDAATNVSAWEVALTYKSDLLNVTRAWVPSTDPQYIFYGVGAMPPTPLLVPGKVLIGDLTLPQQGVSFTTSKKLAILEFQILTAPPEKETLFSNLAIDSVDTFLLDPQIQEIPTSKINGYYQYVGLGGTPSAPTEIQIVPSQLTVGDPYTALPTSNFTINVEVTNVTDLFAWEVKIYFVPSTISFVSATLPPGHVFDGRQYVAIPAEVRTENYSTYIIIGASLIGNQTGFNGNGVLCQLTFYGTTAGNSPLVFTSLQNETTLIDSDLNAIPFDVINGMVTVVGSPPPPPPPPKDFSKIYLYANPQTVIAGQPVNLTGMIIPTKQFVDVMIFAGQPQQFNQTGVLLTTVQTDQYSEFSYTWYPETPGTYELIATWSGDQYTYPAESSPQYVQVEPRPEHDLVVSLIAPDYTLPDASTALNVSVYNMGANTETNVEVELFIEGTIVTSETVPTLTSGSTYVLQYLWTPQAEGTYNVTAYVPGVPGEIDTGNNRMTMFITVAKPLIHPTEGQWAEYNLTAIGPPGNPPYFMLWNFTYRKYISPAYLNVTLTSISNAPYNSNNGWMVLNIVTRQVVMDSGIYWAGMRYPGWIEKDISVGSVVNLLNFNLTVTGSQVIETMGRQIDCWRLDLQIPGGYYPMNYTFFYDKTTGVWVAMNITASTSPPVEESLILVATNIPIGSALKIETDKAMYLRNETVTIQATYKVGDTPIENAEVLIEVDNPYGEMWFTQTVTTDTNGYATLSFNVPPIAVYGTYTIYATAYKTGMQVASATTIFRVVHYQAELTIWFEGPDTALVNQNATITLHVKNIGNLTAQSVTATLFLPTDGDLQVLVAHTPYFGTIEPGHEVTLDVTVTSIRPFRYSFGAMAEYTWEGSIMMPQISAQKTLIYTYHMDYPVDLLNMTVSVTNGELTTMTVNLTVVNYGDSPVEITLIASGRQAATNLMLISNYQEIALDPGQTMTVTLTLTIPWTPAQGDYDIQGILATGLPHDGGFPLTHLDETVTV